MNSRRLKPTDRRAARLLLELLRPEGIVAGIQATADELTRVAELACRHGLFLPVDRRIRERAGLLASGAETRTYRQATRELRRRHVAHVLRYEEAERGVLGILEAASVPTVILKGSRLAADVYGDALGRTSADIDLLVRPADTVAADAALVAAGYRRDNDRPLAFWLRRLHHAVYERPGSVVPVEIHWNFSIPGFFRLDTAEIWSGVEMDGLRGRLGAVDELSLLLMHHHLHGCANLRTLIDLAWAFERRGADAGAGRLPAAITAAGLTVAAGIARSQAEGIWGPRRWDIGALHGRRALRVRLLAAIVASTLRPGRPQRGSDRFRHAAVHRLGLDSTRRAAAAIAKTLLPSPADLRALSGSGRAGVSDYVRYFRWRLGGDASASRPEGRRRR